MSDLSQKNLVKVGKVVNAHSLKGEVKILVFSGEAPWIKKLEKAFLASGGADGAGEEFHIERVRSGNKEIIAKFKGIDDRNAAESLKGRDVLIDATLMTSKKGEMIFLREINGYEVRVGGRVIGVIKGFESNNAQDILIVKLNDSMSEALVPLIKEFIVKIDDAGKFIEMNLPEGLLEVNMKTNSTATTDSKPEKE